MEGFFNILADFLNSDLAKGYWPLLLGCALIIIILTGTLVWLYASKIHFKVQNNQMQDVKKQNAELTNRVVCLENERDKLLIENKQLGKELNMCKFSVAISDDSTEFQDPSLQRFTKKISKT